MCGGARHNSVHHTDLAVTPVSKSCKFKADWWQVASKAEKQVPLPSGPGHYMGCFQDHPDRDIPDLTLFRSHTMTAALCARMCAGFSYYALQSYAECRCAGTDWLPRYGKRPNKECSTSCRGAPTSMCGGAWRNSVFRCVCAEACIRLTDCDQAATTSAKPRRTHSRINGASVYTSKEGSCHRA